MRRKLAAGNWKMNGTQADLAEVTALAARHADAGVDILLCPPATLIAAMTAARGTSAIAVGGQDCHAESSGAHTGDTAAAMLADAGATHVIVGHSERRADYGETSQIVRRKAQAAHAAGLIAVICIGETLQEREAGRTLDVVGGQLSASVPDGTDGTMTVIAYEPVWAIGTGKVPTLDQIAEVHGFLRAQLADRFATGAQTFRLLYGGSVKAGNAADIFGVADVDGALVGGASLTAADFSPIIAALDASR